MTLLCAGDLHGDQDALARFAFEVTHASYDAGVHAGELIDENPTAGEAVAMGLASAQDFENRYNSSLTLEDLDRQIARVEQMRHDPGSVLVRALLAKRSAFTQVLQATGKPVFFVLGNHDPVDWPSTGFLVNVHGRRATLGRIGIVGYLYTPMERSEDEIADDPDVLSPLVAGDTVLVTHSPPYSVLDRTKTGAHIGSRAIYEFIKRRRPRLHVFGHVHESAGRHGLCLNASYFANYRFYRARL